MATDKPKFQTELVVKSGNVSCTLADLTPGTIFGVDGRIYVYVGQRDDLPHNAWALCAGCSYQSRRGLSARDAPAGRACRMRSNHEHTNRSYD